MTEDQDKFCPACDARRPWFQNDCAECGTSLVPLPERYAVDPDRPPVGVLTTSDPATLTLAELALSDERIEHLISHAELADWVGRRTEYTPGGTGTWWTVKVRAK